MSNMDLEIQLEEIQQAFKEVRNRISKIKTFQEMLMTLPHMFEFIDNASMYNSKTELDYRCLDYHKVLAGVLRHDFSWKMRTCIYEISSEKVSIEISGVEVGEIVHNIDQSFNAQMKADFISGLLNLSKLSVLDNLIVNWEGNKSQIILSALNSFGQNYPEIIFSLPNSFLQHILDNEYNPPGRFRVSGEGMKCVLIDFIKCHHGFLYSFYRNLIVGARNKSEVSFDRASQLIIDYFNFMTIELNGLHMPNDDIMDLNKEFNLMSVVNAFRSGIYGSDQISFHEIDVSSTPKSTIEQLPNGFTIFSFKNDPYKRIFNLVPPDIGYFVTSNNDHSYDNIFDSYKNRFPSFLISNYQKVNHSILMKSILDMEFIIEDVSTNAKYSNLARKTTSKVITLSALYSTHYLLHEIPSLDNEHVESLKYLVDLYLGYLGLREFDKL